MKLCGFEVGLDRPFFLIAGPCVIESMQLQLDTAGKLKEITSALGIPFIFKSSFDKANRTSGTSFRGPGLEGANSTENDRKSPYPVIGLITEWRTASGDIERRSEESDLGGTMRLGLQEQRIKPGTLAHKLYGADVVGERHRHRYEFNNRFRTQLEDAGLVVSAKSMDDTLVEMIELPQSQHPWFLACQAHPEFLSTPRSGHPLFIGFIRAAREHKAQAGGRLLKEASA